MSADLPTAASIRAALETLTYAQGQRLSLASGVPFTTIWKIRDGITKNPGIETVRMFLPHLESLQPQDLSGFGRLDGQAQEEAA